MHCPGTKLNADSGFNVFLVSLFLKIHKQNYHVLKLFNLAFHGLIQCIKYRHCPWLLTLQLRTNKNSTYAFTKLKLWCNTWYYKTGNKIQCRKIHWSLLLLPQSALQKCFTCDELIRSESISFQILGAFGDLLAVHSYRIQAGTFQLDIRVMFSDVVCVFCGVLWFWFCWGSFCCVCFLLQTMREVRHPQCLSLSFLSRASANWVDALSMEWSLFITQLLSTV